MLRRLRPARARPTAQVLPPAQIGAATQAPLALGALFALLSASLYAYVGHRIGKRHVEPGAQLPLLAFAAWWFGLGTVTAIGGTASLLAAFGALDPDLFITATYYNLFVLSVALAGLLEYLLFLFTGRASWWKLLLPAYSAYALFLVYVIRSHRPSGVTLHRWNVSVRYEIPLEGSPLVGLAIFLLVVPQILGSLAYLLLATRTRERTLRYRITVVSLSLILWFGSILLASGAGLGDSDAWQLASRAIGLAAAGCILAAYYPPRLLRRRYGLVSIDEPLR